MHLGRLQLFACRLGLILAFVTMPGWVASETVCNASETAKHNLPANFNEAEVPPYTLPDPLMYQDGTRVRDAVGWHAKRRPELLQLFASEIYGRTLLDRPSQARFIVREVKKHARGGRATRMRVSILFEGHAAGRQMELLIYLPNNASSPVPVFLGLNFDGNYTTTDEPDIPVPRHWATGLRPNRVRANTTEESSRGVLAHQWQYDYALDHGYGVATVAYGEVEPDADACWQQGPRGLAPAPGPGDWGSIGAWAWALSRALDYLATNPLVDAERIVLIGFSRLGKTALWAGAQDQRFAMVVANCSGGGGAALSKRLYGERVHNLTDGPAWWFCRNFRQYAANETLLPVDQHQLIALIAPRPVLITSATEDRWADPKGEFLAAVGADPVYRLLGTSGLTEREWPEAGRLLTGQIGYYLRSGEHDVTLEDWRAMVTFANLHLRR